MTINPSLPSFLVLVGLLFRINGVVSFSNVVRRNAPTRDYSQIGYVRKNGHNTQNRSHRVSQGVKLSWANSATPATVVDTTALDGLGIPNGLRETLLANAQERFSKRIWIIDNSGSMAIHDGHQILNCNKDCSRWAELQETVKCHAQLSAAIGAPTDFRLLNPPSNGGPQRFRVGYGRLPPQQRYEQKRARHVMERQKPSGMTPLHTCITEIRKEVVQMLPQLESDGLKVAIVIATDGCNHDKTNVSPHSDSEVERNQELLEALESLQGLPVWVVVRLCTDYGPVVDFYNGLDERVELNLDVLDDYVAEAEEVHDHNPWLNYALILHRMREMGQYSRLFDLLDERPFTREEIRDFCVLLFGMSVEELPDPTTEWFNFISEINRVQQNEQMHLNPVTHLKGPWIDLGELAKVEEEASSELLAVSYG